MVDDQVLLLTGLHSRLLVLILRRGWSMQWGQTLPLFLKDTLHVLTSDIHHGTNRIERDTVLHHQLPILQKHGRIRVFLMLKLPLQS